MKVSLQKQHRYVEKGKSRKLGDKMFKLDIMNECLLNWIISIDNRIIDIYNTKETQIHN